MQQKDLIWLQLSRRCHRFVRYCAAYETASLFSLVFKSIFVFDLNLNSFATNDKKRYSLACIKPHVPKCYILGPIIHPRCQLNIALIRAYYLISRALILICHFLIFLQLWRETLQFGLYRAPCAKVLLGPIGRPKRCPGAGRPRPIWLPEIQWYRKFLLNRKLQQPLPLRFCPCPFLQTLWRIYPDFI